MNKVQIILYAVTIIRHLLKMFWIFPIRNNRVYLVSLSGTQYSCNPKYLAEYLSSEYPGKFDIVFSVKKGVNYNHNAVRAVKYLSLSDLYNACTAKVIVSNGGFPKYIPKRNKQYAINTWHGGGAYKKNLPNIQGIDLKMNLYKSKCTNLILSSCQSFSEKVIPDFFAGYTGEILKCGMPRNDIFFTDEKDRANMSVRNLLSMDNQSVLVLYAPTYRGGYYRNHNNFSLSIDYEKVKSALRTRYCKDIVIVFRAHAMMNNTANDCVDVTSYPNMQELLCAADILISDYSSTIWDFSLTKKPCFLYCPDLDYYLYEDRGVYTPIETWPGILCRTNEELEQAILNFDEDEYVKKVEKHHADLGSYENGTACKQVCKRIAEVCGIEEES